MTGRLRLPRHWNYVPRNDCSSGTASEPASAADTARVALTSSSNGSFGPFSFPSVPLWLKRSRSDPRQVRVDPWQDRSRPDPNALAMKGYDPAGRTRVTREDLVAGLREMGVAPGALLQVHSSLSALGYVEGGADAVVDALL